LEGNPWNRSKVGLSAGRIYESYPDTEGYGVKVELLTYVMIQNLETNEVLIQNRKRKYPGYSFPGGHVEPGESFYDCAVREVKEETGLNVYNLKYCGVVHWVNLENDDRYICFMYKSTEFDGQLILETNEGIQFWLDIDELFSTPKEKLASASEHYILSPLLHEYGKYSEVTILWSGDESTWETFYK
jgi:8-oxo-dGTP diphosphatase